MGYTRCITEPIYKLHKLRQASQYGFLTQYLILSVPFAHARCPSHSIFTYLVLALRATDWQAVRTEPLNMAAKCMVGGQSAATLSTLDNTDFFYTTR